MTMAELIVIDGFGMVVVQYGGMVVPSLPTDLFALISLC
jgi:hypothetical protein